ncbi:MAG: hypothetical protein PHV06_00750 [bacterium]|nr:hypothetical protein [bacterium]
MIKKSILLLMLVILLQFTLLTFVCSEDEVNNLRDHAPKIYIDSHVSIDTTYIKSQITFLNYVIEKNEADIHLLITSQNTGSGGQEYSLQFIGKNKFAGQQFTVKYYTDLNFTSSDVREGLIEKIKQGVMPFVANTPISEKIEVNFEESSDIEKITDPWNHWMFSVSLSGNTSGQESSNELHLNGGISIQRITQEHKYSFSFSYDYDNNYYDFSSYEYESTYESKDIFTRYVLSLGEHWAWALEFYGNTSTYDNIDKSGRIATGIEYNIFPYSETTVHTFKFRYKLHYLGNWYLEETIYDKIEEQMLKQSLAIVYSNTQTWGNIWCMLSGIHDIDDFDFNSSTLNLSINLRLTRGLFFNYWVNLSAVHDQVSLPKGGATEEEILLRRKALETQYTYDTGIGITLTFGSIFSNIVNTRFD